MNVNEVYNKLDLPSLGIGYIRLVWNDRHEAADYMFLDFNPVLEQMTGLSREDILHKEASSLAGLAGIFQLSYFEDVARSGRTQETTQWIEPLKRSLKVTAVPLDAVTLLLVIRDEAPMPDEYEEVTVSFPDELAFFFDKTHDAISLAEYSGGGFRYLGNNAVHQVLTGFSDIHGMTPVQLLGEEVGAKLEGYYETCMLTGRPVSYEQKFSFAPGDRVWQTVVTPVVGNDGRRYLWCASKDVSELKKAQGENELLAQRLSSMFVRHAAVMLMIEPVSGRIVDANPAACAFYGYSKEELQSILIRDIHMMPPEKTGMQNRMAYAGKAGRFCIPHRLKNGDIRMVDTYSCPISDGENMLFYSIVFDVTDREAYREELYREKEMLLTTLRSIGDGVVTTDGKGLIKSLNTVGQEITGWSDEEARGRMFTEVFRLFNEETGEPVENPIQKVLNTGRIIGLANHTVLVDRSGLPIPIADSAAPIKTEKGKILGVVMVFRDVSGEKEYNKQIEFLSYHDPLTGLFNRRYVEKTMSRLDVAENFPISVVLGDVNGLKITNDVFGHKAGDVILQNVTAVLRENCRAGDLLARWGGDEFVVFMPRTGIKEAEAFIHRIMDTHIPSHEGGLSLSMSLGCAAKENMETEIETVLREAEESMYHQKLLNQKSYRNAIINTLLATLYEKSNETEEHSKRLEKHCHSIGRAIQLSSKDMAELSLLALLHDIGKVSTHSAILQKPGPLTPEEREEMQRHSEIGYRIAQVTPELSSIADLIIAHHEHWDGTGYPRGLKGNEIPLACRILAVTDAYDAMTNDRAYRAAKSHEEAVSELLWNAGTQFDPQIVKLFVQILRAERGMGKNSNFPSSKGW